MINLHSIPPMPVSTEYREFVLEQLGRVTPVSSRAMFGGVGIYSEGLFFALIDDDTVFFKVDETNRARFTEAGMSPFQPYGEGSRPMQYFELPAELLEEPESLLPWVESSLEVARRKGKKKR
jgi:DNA transformation protein and related proteins